MIKFCELFDQQFNGLPCESKYTKGISCKLPQNQRYWSMFIFQNKNQQQRTAELKRSESLMRALLIVQLRRF